MKRNNVQYILICTSLIFWSSCKSWRKSFNEKDIKSKSVIELSVNHHYKNQKSDHKLFYIFTDLDNFANRDFEVLNIVAMTGPYSSFEIFPEDSIGKVSKTHLPNRLIDKKNRLYLWNDSITPLSKDILETLHKYNALDSTRIKIRQGLLSAEDYPDKIYRTGGGEPGLYYFVCKKDKKRFRNVKSKWIIPKEKYPTNICR